MTKIDIIKNKLLTDGIIDNWWCIDNRITTRLGAVIHKLSKDGWVFRGYFGDDRNEKNYYYQVLAVPNSERYN